MSVSKISSARSLLNKTVLGIKGPNVWHRQYGTQVAQSLQFPNALYGGRHTVSLLPGDGIGPETASYVREVFKAARVPVEFEDVKFDKLNNSEEHFNKALLSIKRNGIALKGSMESQYADPLFKKSSNAIMRVELDLFVNVLHAKSYENTRGRPNLDNVLHAKSYENTRGRPNLDIAVIRQNTGGEYAMLEHETVPGVVECIKIITRSDSERLGHFAFNFARSNKRKKVTCVHKANIQKLSDGLFLESIEKVSKMYPEIAFNHLIVDNTCMQLALNPYQFDVIVAPNLYGLVVQNVICGLAGGAGIFGGSNIGDKVSVFEPGTRNIGADLAHNIANPLAMLNASVDMLHHMRLSTYADVISEAISKTVTEDQIHTRDLGGNASSLDMVQNIIKRIKELSF